MKKIFNGEKLKEARLYNKLSITELADKLNVTKQMISKYESNKSEPSFEKSLLLTEILNYPREFFYSKEPFEIINEGTFFRSRLTATQKSKEPAAISTKYSVIVRDFLEKYIDFPKLHDRSKYEQIDSIEDVALEIRKDMNLGLNPIQDIVEVAELMGFTVINLIYEEDKVDAFSSMNIIDGREYFIITIDDMSSFFRQQFSLAHEIGHWVLHQHLNPQELDKDEYKEMEAEANNFAAAFLLPKNSFGIELQKLIVDEIETYYNLKRIWNVSMAAMIMRAKQLGIIDSEQELKLYKQMHYRKWRNPEPFDLDVKMTVPVSFKQSLELLIDENVLKGHEIKAKLAEEYGLYLTTNRLAMICGVEPAIFNDNSQSRVVLKLKDFKVN